MKTFAVMMVAVLSMAALSACQVTAKDRNSSVHINNNADGYHGHCPPGHAKKGWC
jgi:hypothetical protein